MKNRFKKNDEIALLRLGQIIQKGIVLCDAIRIEKVDHYKVNWTWSADATNFKNTDEDIVCDLPTKKYQLTLI